MKLTFQLLQNAKPQSKPYKLRDRDSMYLRVSGSGSKVWKFDYRLDGKDCSYTLGRFPDLSMPECEEWLEDNRGKWTAYYHAQATRFLARYVKGSPLGTMTVRDIKVSHVYDLLQSIAKRKAPANDERKAEGAPHIAIRVRQHLDAMFRRAIVSGRVDANPVAALKASDVVTLPPTRHNRALEAHELKHLLATFSVTGTQRTHLAMRLLLLTSLRSVEVQGGGR